LMKLLTILAALAFSVAAFGQTICQLPPTGPQLYSKAPGVGVPQHVPGALNEYLGYIPQDYVALPGMPASPLAFCGPAWQPNYAYAVGNLIELSNGTVLQAIVCTALCESGATEPPGFSGMLFEPSPVGAWISACSDPGSTATCTTVDSVGDLAGINQDEPYEGANVGATVVITQFTNSAYNGPWVVTASTNTPNPCGGDSHPACTATNFSFAASGFNGGTCAPGQVPNCTTYQQGSQIADHDVIWQDVGPQNESVLLTPTVTVTPSASSITTAQTLNVTVAVGGGSGNPTPTGTVTLTGGGYTSSATTLSDGSATIDIPAGSLAVGTDTLTATYSGDGNYSTATGTSSVAVTAAQTPSFTITGTAVSVSPGATTGNTSTITVTPMGGFMGSVTLTAAVTSSPAGAQFLPMLSFGSTSPVNITSGSAGTTTLTAFTTAATGAALAYPVRPRTRWYTVSGNGLVAFALLFSIPAQRRSWRTMLGMLALLATLIGIGGLLACGGSGAVGVGNSGTTPGTYTVTVTGTSGSTTATSPPISITVQ
jgi:hypothetical protein